MPTPMPDPMPDRHELEAWLRLLLTPGLGLIQARRLLQALGSPQAIWSAPPSVWADVLAQRDLRAWGQPPEGLAEQVQRTLDWAQLDGRHVLSLADPRYPARLLEAADPPLLLFVEGDLRTLAAPSVAVVGSRHATPQGLAHARAFSQALAEAGVVVVSGLARGIDAAAHEGALAAGEAQGCPCTLAVVGTGLDVVYPKANAALARRIVRHGLLLSEFTLGAPPLAAHFPRRNRIVAALTHGTLVVEAALQSGSLITARLAADMGRDVMAIPGSILAPQSQGCHALIKQGARLVDSVQDVLDELAIAPVVPVTAIGPSAGAEAGGGDRPHAPESDPVLASMGYDPIGQDALSARTGLGPAELGARLLELELGGLVARLPGQLFQRQRAA